MQGRICDHCKAAIVSDGYHVRLLIDGGEGAGDDLHTPCLPEYLLEFDGEMAKLFVTAQQFGAAVSEAFASALRRLAELEASGATGCEANASRSYEGGFITALRSLHLALYGTQLEPTLPAPVALDRSTGSG